MSRTDNELLTTSVHERAIIRGLNRFARILERREWSAVREVFADEVSSNYGDGLSIGASIALTSTFSGLPEAYSRPPAAWSLVRPATG